MNDYTVASTPVCWRFGHAVFNERNHELRIDGQLVAMERKPLDVLLCLLRAEGELVTKEELFDAVWAGRIVTDGVLSQAIRRIREALGDTERRMLRTVHGYGFRLDIPIELEGQIEKSTQLALEPDAPVPGLPGWTLEQRLSVRPANELWRIRHRDSDELRVIKLALHARAERALKREVTLNRVLRAELGDDAPLVPLLAWQFERSPAWIQMPWYAAGSLVDWIDAQGGAQQVPLERRVRIVAEAADALARAHALGVMHKDIKPANLLVDDSGAQPRLLLCDFGNGAVHSRERLVDTGVTVMGFTQTIQADASSTGTPAYMAPELLAGKVFSERSEVYALGVMLYQLVAGDLQQPLAPGWEADVADAGLRGIIASAGAGRPEHRMGSAAELARRLRDWRPGQLTPQTPTRQSYVQPVVRTVGAAVLALLLVLVLRPLWSPPAPAPDPLEVPAAARRPPSIAVLPFKVLSTSEEDRFLAEGLHDALLTNLAGLNGMRVISRASVLAYANGQTRARQIASELGVSSVVEASFQHSDERIRVQIRLINGRDESQLWADSFDHRLDDIFAVQNALSRRISAAVGAVLSAAEKEELSQMPTVSAAAYSEFLTARALYAEGILGTLEYSRILGIRQRLSRALDLDPRFLEARALLVQMESLARYYAQIPHGKAVANIEEHLAHLDAQEPENVLTRFARASYLLYVLEKAPDALAVLEPVAQRLPRTSNYQLVYADLLRRQWRPAEAIAVYRAAMRLDPRNFELADSLADTHHYTGEYAQAYEVAAAAAQRMPSSRIAQAWPHYRFAIGRGMPSEVSKFFALLRPERDQTTSPVDWFYAAIEAYSLGGAEAALSVLDAADGQVYRGTGNSVLPAELYRAIVGFAAGRPAQQVQADARFALRSMDANAREDDNHTLQGHRALALALLGRKGEAHAQMERTLRQVSEVRDAVQWVVQMQVRVVLPVLLGDEELALAQLREFLHAQYRLPANQLKFIPIYAPLMSNPRTAALINAESARTREQFDAEIAQMGLAWPDDQPPAP